MLLHLTWIAPLILLIWLLSPRFRGDIAQSRVRRILENSLEKRRYTLLNDVVIPSGGGTVCIDHLVVSRCGIFVIKSQYASGWVSGTAVQDRWKQHHLSRITRFDNPLHSNTIEAEALAAVLQYPLRALHPLVVLVGAKGFKGERPHRVLEPEKLDGFIHRQSEPRLETEQAAEALQRIEAARLKRPDGFWSNTVSLVRAAVFLALLAGLYLSFGDSLREISSNIDTERQRRASPEAFHADGARKTEQELREQSLRCAWSEDTGRCACYDPEGIRVDLPVEKCRELAERGSILKQ